MTYQKDPVEETTLFGVRLSVQETGVPRTPNWNRCLSLLLYFSTPSDSNDYSGVPIH